eukprot:1890701-Ditylum_brightwellii.AAC.1
MGCRAGNQVYYKTDTTVLFQTGTILTTPDDNAIHVVLQDNHDDSVHTIPTSLTTAINPHYIDSTTIPEETSTLRAQYLWVHNKVKATLYLMDMPDQRQDT